MSHALVLQFDSAFAAGSVIPVLRDFGIPINICRLDRGEALPEDHDEVRALILLGGMARMTEADGYSDVPEWMDDVVEFVKPRVEADAMTLGFGLGGQILAKAAGADVTPLKAGDSDDAFPDPHLGFGQLTLPFPGGTDPILFGYGNGVPQLFFQKDQFELPKLPPPDGYDPDKPGPPPPTGNALLASVPWCKNAGFRFKNRLYGFAFQPEVDAKTFEKIVAEHGGAIGAVGGSGAVDELRSKAEQHLPRAERMGRKLLENAVQFMHAYNPPMPLYT